MAERTVNGQLTIMANGYGILGERSYDVGGVYVSMDLIRRFGLRSGDHVVAVAGRPRRDEHYLCAQQIQLINGRRPALNA